MNHLACHQWPEKNQTREEWSFQGVAFPGVNKKQHGIFRGDQGKKIIWNFPGS